LDNRTDPGFILTCASSDRNRSTVLTLWLCTPSGPAKLEILDERPVFFVEQRHEAQLLAAFAHLGNPPHARKLPLKTFGQEPVTALYCRTQRESFDAQALLKRSGIPYYEADLKLGDRYLMERFVYGSLAFSGALQQSGPYRAYQCAQIRPSTYRPALKALSLDIECSLEGHLYCIGLYARHADRQVRHVVMIGAATAAQDWISWVDDERTLLQRTVELINAFDPDVIIGWNVVDFDFRLLLRRARELGVALLLGRDGGAAIWRDSRTNQKLGFAVIPGRVVIDGISALKTATYSFQSFSLEYVARQLLGRGKKIDDAAHRIDEIVHNFHHDKEKLAAYNLEDCILTWDIFAHAKLLEFLVFRSQITGLELDRLGGSVAAFSNLYLPRLHRAGYIAPNLPTGAIEGTPGGYVLDSRPGLYKNIIVLDFKSLYPSIIRTFKIDPVGMIEGLLDPGQAIAGFEGAVFSRRIHFLPDIITHLWQERDEAKANQDHARSQAVKIIMNSFYGVLASGGCRFYDTRLSSSITMRGHQVLLQTSQWVAQLGYEVIYGDTDSIFISLPPEASHAQCDRIGRKIQDDINRRWQHEIQERHSLECHLEIQFDCHYSRFLMPTIRGSELGSKKRYAGLAQSMGEAGLEEKLVFKGLESVRSDWTELAKMFQRDLFDCIFHDQNPTEIINLIIHETRSGLRDTDLVYRKRLRRALHLYQKNIPPQVRAARIADDWNRIKLRPLQYQNKGWVSYVMTSNGPEPVEYQSHPLDYEHYIEKQLRPVADAILPLIGLSFDRQSQAQLELF
jgi:DNA polymerase-2